MCLVMRWSKELTRTAFYQSFMIVYSKAENCLSQQNFNLTHELIKDQLNIDKECVLKANRFIVPDKLKDKILQMIHSEQMGISKTNNLPGIMFGGPKWMKIPKLWSSLANLVS